MLLKQFTSLILPILSFLGVITQILGYVNALPSLFNSDVNQFVVVTLGLITLSIATAQAFFETENRLFVGDVTTTKVKKHTQKTRTVLASTLCLSLVGFGYYCWILLQPSNSELDKPIYEQPRVLSFIDVQNVRKEAAPPSCKPSGFEKEIPTSEIFKPESIMLVSPNKVCKYSFELSVKNGVNKALLNQLVVTVLEHHPLDAYAFNALVRGPAGMITANSYYASMPAKTGASVARAISINDRDGKVSLLKDQYLQIERDKSEKCILYISADAPGIYTFRVDGEFASGARTERRSIIPSQTWLFDDPNRKSATQDSSEHTESESGSRTPF